MTSGWRFKGRPPIDSEERNNTTGLERKRERRKNKKTKESLEKDLRIDIPANARTGKGRRGSSFIFFSGMRGESKTAKLGLIVFCGEQGSGRGKGNFGRRYQEEGGSGRDYAKSKNETMKAEPQ